MLKSPFEVSFEEVKSDLDIYVSSVFSCLESEFMVMPKGPGFVEYPAFEQGYEALKNYVRIHQYVRGNCLSCNAIGAYSHCCLAFHAGVYAS